MKKIFNSFIVIILFFFITSCGEPPEGVKEIRLVDLIQSELQKLNDFKDDDDKLLNYLKFMTNKFEAVLTFPRDTSIFINSKEASPGKDDFMYTLDRNRFIITRPLYITAEKKDTLYSFDNKTWYNNKSDPNKEIEGIRNNYFFDTKIEGDNIYVNYTMSFSVGRVPLIVELKDEREIVTLEKGMIFSNEDEKLITTDLNKKILFIPEHTIISGDINIHGNLIKSRIIENDLICVKAEQNIYLYIKGKKFSISFDKINWNPNVLSFQIEPTFDVRAIDDKHIFFDLAASAYFHEDKISMSIINLLLKAL